MPQLTEEERLQKAIWRYDVIAPLLREDMPRGTLTGLLRELAGRFHVNDQHEMVRLSERTLEHTWPQTANTAGALVAKGV